MRLPNGYGSVTKLSGNRRRPYIVRITAGWDAFGKREVRILGYYAKRSEALAALAEYNANPYDPAARSITFAELHTKWLENRELAENSQYKAAYNYCRPLWDMPFNQIKTAQFQKIINDCDKGYATKKAIRIVCNLMAKYALGNDIAMKNYVELTKLPPQTDSRMHKPFTPSELSKIWNDAAGNIKIQAVLILCYTGLRPTELLKIRKENVHFDEHYMEGGIKTAAGKNRFIPIADKILPFIHTAYNTSTGETLYSKEDGQPMTYDVFNSKYWKPVMNMYKLDHLPHDGRHTCATLLDNADVNEKIRKLILGHAGKDITEKVYTHKTLQQLIEAINKI